MKAMRRQCHEKRATPTTHVLKIAASDVPEWAEVYYNMDHFGTDKKFHDGPKMTLDLFIAALETGQWRELTFRGMIVEWFSDGETRVEKE
jgi:hypothetical protein